MRKIATYELIFLALLVTTLSGCEIIGDIFKAGVWVGVILVLAVVFIIIRLLSGRK